MEWQPEGFDAFRALHPATPQFTLPDLRPTQRFIAHWHALNGPTARALHATLAAQLQNTTLILIRGFMGNFMPGNLVAAQKALRALGLDAWIANNSARATVEDNARHLAQQVRRRMPATRSLLFLGHSKGGLEALWLTAAESDLAARTRGVILSQTPHGPSPVLESLLLKRHQESLPTKARARAEALQRFGLWLLGCGRGGRELTGERVAEVLSRLDQAPRGFALLQTASWSSRPTTWLDSFHERLGEIRPGCAHDGQFYLEELIWPSVPHVLLPHVDHAQPVMGGFGFDSARYWLASLALLLEAPR